MHSHALIVHSFKEKNMSIFIRVSRHVSKKDFEFFKELRLIFVCIAICVFMLTDEILFPFQVHVHHDLINRKGVCVSQNVHIINFPWHMKSKWETLRKNELSTRRERWDFETFYIEMHFYCVWCVYCIGLWNYLYLFFSYSITDTNFSLSQSVSEDGMVLYTSIAFHTIFSPSPPPFNSSASLSKVGMHTNIFT